MKKIIVDDMLKTLTIAYEILSDGYGVDFTVSKDIIVIHLIPADGLAFDNIPFSEFTHTLTINGIEWREIC